MNWLDIVLLIILAGSVFTSFRKGFSREVIGLVSVVVALVLGIWFYGTAGAYLIPYLSSRSAANFGGFLLVFCGVLFIGGLVSFVVGKFLKVTGLSIFDHALGAAFGAARGIVISIALIMAIIAFSPGGQTPGSVVHSTIAPYVTGAAGVIASIAPHDVREGFHETYAHVKETWHSALREKQSDAQSGKETK